jgi:dimethylamine monooxygenase subunit A
MPFDFAAVAAPFRMQPGLRRVVPGSAPLTLNRPGDAALAAKLDALSHHPEHALLAARGFDAAPALDALIAQAAADHPGAFAHTAAHHLEARLLGWSVLDGEPAGTGPAAIGDCLRALPRAWRLPGLLCLALAEDFAVIDGATARIPWLAVCLPSRWAPEEKVGRHFAEVHAPVADNAMLLAAADHLARLVTGPERWERFVWTVSADARLAQHPRHAPRIAWPVGTDADELAARAWFRTEHQSFIPVPRAAQAVFTIHVESRPLTSAIESPAQARQLHGAIASMSAAVLAYRGLAEARERLLAWLDARAA